MAKALSKGFGPQHIRVNTVGPGPVATDFWAGSDGVASVLGDASGKSAEQVTEEFASNSMGARVTIDGGMVPTL